MSNVNLLVGLFNNAITSTEFLIDDLLAGTQPTQTAIITWQQNMFALGLIPDPDTFGSSGSGGDVDMTLLLSAINAMFDGYIGNLDASIQQGLLVLRADLAKDINNHANAIRNDIDVATNGIISQVQQTTSAVLETLQNFTQQIIAGQQNLLSDIQQLFVNNRNSTIQLLDAQTNTLNNQINGQTSTLLNAIQSIDGGGSGSNGGSTPPDLQGIESLLTDMLSVLSDWLNAFINTDFTPDVTVNVSGDSGGSNGGSNGGSGGSDNSAFIPGNIDAIRDKIALMLGEETAQYEGGLFHFEGVLFDPDIKKLPNLNELMTIIKGNTLLDGALGSLIVALSFIMRVLGIAQAANNPFLNNVETLARKTALDNLPTREELVRLDVRNKFDKAELTNRYAQLGISTDLRDLIVEASQRTLPDTFLREALLRETITPQQWQLGMLALGYHSDDLATIEPLLYNYPPTQDAILFAVREAYDDNLAQDLGLDENYSDIQSQFEEVLQANGVAKEWGKLYWRAHWRLPSVTMGYDMFHKGIITGKELKQLLQVSDFSPRWQDNLVENAYSEYTRVDIRRMHKIGVLTDSEVLNAYMRIGYNLERAQNLTAFTIRLNNTGEDDGASELTRPMILGAFNNQILTYQQAENALRDTGLSKNASRLMLETSVAKSKGDVLGDVTRDNRRRIVNQVSREFITGILPESFVRTALQTIGYPSLRLEEEIGHLELERLIQVRVEENDQILNQYLKYQITKNQASDMLASKGYSSAEQSRILELWENVREDKKGLPTKSEAKRFWESGQINDEQYKDILRGHGVIEKYIPLYLGQSL